MDRPENNPMNECLSLRECYPAASIGNVVLKRYQVFWKTDWNKDEIVDVCTATSKEAVIRDYHLRSADVIWFEIHEIPKI